MKKLPEFDSSGALCVATIGCEESAEATWVRAGRPNTELSSARGRRTKVGSPEPGLV